MHFHPHYRDCCPAITESVQKEGGRGGGRVGNQKVKQKEREKERERDSKREGEITKPEAYCIITNDNTFRSWFDKRSVALGGRV